jgi:hypothetical protein
MSGESECCENCGKYTFGELAALTVAVLSDIKCSDGISLYDFYKEIFDGERSCKNER